MLPRIPWADGIIDADVRPMMAFKMIKVMGSRAKPVARAKAAKTKRLVSRMLLRPNMSATLPKKSKKEPDVRLDAAMTQVS